MSTGVDPYFVALQDYKEKGLDFADFCWGQPCDPPRPEMLAALRGSLAKGSDPEAPPSYFGYDTFSAESMTVVELVKKHRRVEVEAEDCFLTNGALGAIPVVLQVLTDPGDEVIMITPWYFFYPAICQALGVKLVGVSANADDYSLDLKAIDAAITPRTRAILVNSPNNPTGVIYSKEALDALGALLSRRSAECETPIMLISDEAYCRIVFEGAFAPSPCSSYDYSIMIYTFGKTTLAPGERLGYIALSPGISKPHREELREAIKRTITITWARPSTACGHAIAEMDKAIIDIKALEKRRDRLFDALSSQGYKVTKPQGTFYMMVRCPGGLTGFEFRQQLADLRVLVVAGELVGLPASIRLSVTVADKMIDYAVPVFAKFATPQTDAKATSPSKRLRAC